MTTAILVVMILLAAGAYLRIDRWNEVIHNQKLMMDRMGIVEGK